MKMIEAMGKLDEGYKIRDVDWAVGEFIFKDKLGFILDNDNLVASLQLTFDDEWEIYEEPEHKKEWVESYVCYLHPYSTHTSPDFTCQNHLNETIKVQISKLRGVK